MTQLNVSTMELNCSSVFPIFFYPIKNCQISIQLRKFYFQIKLTLTIKLRLIHTRVVINIDL